METFITDSNLNQPQELNSLTLPVWKRLSQKRVVFFARHEALFLGLLGTACLIYGLGWLLTLVSWSACQFAVLESLTHDAVLESLTHGAGIV